MLELKYFVLKPKAKRRNDPHATASQEAMRAYALSIREHDSELFNSLIKWADEERSKQNNLKRRKNVEND